MVDKKQYLIMVEVAYALPHKQMIVDLEVNVGTTVYLAAKYSKITEHFENLDLDSSKMGIFGKIVKDPHKTILSNGQRVEIYRPLIITPQESRAKRIAKLLKKSMDA